MKSSRKRSLLQGLASICLTAGLLGAADVTGSFTLPSQTQWGSAVLPAGDYTFTLDHATLDGQIVLKRQPKGPSAVVLAQGMNPAGSSGASSMRIVGNRVRSLYLAPAGLTYSYQTHPEQREILARSSGVPGITVAITTK